MLSIEEFRSSGIPDHLTLANVSWMEGDDAIQILAQDAITQVQRVNSYITQPAKRILERYEFAEKGGWVTYGTDLDGTLGKVAYFKPVAPRSATNGFGGEVKRIKYETPARTEALPLLPWVTYREAAKIAKQHGVIKEYETWLLSQGIPTKTGQDREPSSPSTEGTGANEVGSGGFGGSDAQQHDSQGALEQREHFIFDQFCEFDNAEQVDSTFWKFVQQNNLPVAITEGFKKALALVAHGIPAIALRGVTCWHKKGNQQQLHQQIDWFATKGRQLYLIFDQDEKPTTQKNVKMQVLALGRTLESRDAKVAVTIWDRKLGKGIDDCLFVAGDNADKWLFQVIMQSLSLKAYRKEGWEQRAIATIDRLNQLSFPVERETKGEYLPELPSLERGTIHVVAASINSGKTTRIGEDWVKPFVESGGNVLILCPLNSLGQQTAKNCSIPHIHDYNPNQQQLLWSEVSYSHGIVLCAESLLRIPEWFWQRPVLLICDEANQMINTLTEGNTLGNRFSDILLQLNAAAKRAVSNGAIVLSEDGIPNRAVNFIKSISGAEKVRVFTHQKQGTPWDCTVYSGKASGFRAAVIATATTKRILFVTSSQREAKLLEYALPKDSRKVVRIDSETNQKGEFTAFFNNPDRWLEDNQPDVLILSPSAKSGVSIEGGISTENAYFAEIWAYFPALSTDDHMQLLGRYRPSVPRYVFVPPFIQASGDESLGYPSAIKRRIGLNARAIAYCYQLTELLEATGDRAEHLVTVETAVLDYLVAARTVAGAQKSLAHDELIRRLERAGHYVVTQKCEPSKATSELWKQLREQIWQEEADEIAAATIVDIHTPEWAYQTLSSLEASLKTRTIARKILWRLEFPGVDFDDQQECYEALCYDYGTMRRGVLLQARAENLECSKESDRQAAESILSAPIKAFHRLPKGHVRARLIAKTGILNLLEGTYSNTDPRAIAVKQEALKWANEIGYWLQLQIKESQTPIAICNKLLRKLGLESKSISRPGRRGEQNPRIYQVTNSDNPTRIKLLEAARRKLPESVSTIRSNQEPIQITDTAPQPLRERRFRWRSSIGVWVIESVEGDFAVIHQETGWAAGIKKRVLLSELTELGAIA